MAEPSDKGVVERVVTTVSPYDKRVAGTLRVREWSADQRSVRAIKRLLACWAGALVVGGIPPHLPWFALMFLAGPVAASLAWRLHGTILAQEIACPDCATRVAVEEQPEGWPLNARCRGCRNIFSIERDGPPPAAAVFGAAAGPGGR